LTYTDTIAMDPRNLPGHLKVAILLQSLGREETEKILNSLQDAEREMIKNHLSQLGAIQNDLVEKVAAEFAELASRGKMTEKSNVNPNESFDSPITPGTDNFTVLQSIKPEHLFEVIKEEHPQTIAIILAHLKPDKASEVITQLPDAIKSEVAIRIASLGKIASEIVAEISRALEDELKNKQTTTTQDTGGVRCIADILNQITDGSSESILREIAENNPDLADQIKQRMFEFEHIILIDDRGLQKLLRKVEAKELAIALKGASIDVKEKIYRNMSERAKEMLMEELEMLGSVRMKEVEDAQQMIIRIIQEMEGKGELIISGRGGDVIV
jgi:flagellar motor switch protein FliG